MTLNEFFDRQVPIVISKSSPPNPDFHLCEVYRTDSGDKHVAIVRGQMTTTSVEYVREAFAEAFGMDVCNACVFCCSYGKLEGDGQLAEREYESRFYGSSRLGARMYPHQEICRACFEREVEFVHSRAAKDVARLQRMLRAEAAR
jgi:hypothetical protein